MRDRELTVFEQSLLIEHVQVQLNRIKCCLGVKEKDGRNVRERKRIKLSNGS
jgi:hypothetical protein